MDIAPGPASCGSAATVLEELSCRPSFQALVSAAAACQHQPCQCAESRGDQRENNQLDTNMAFAAARILKDKQQKEQQQENKRVIHITHPWTALCVLHTRLSCHIWSSYYVTGIMSCHPGHHWAIWACLDVPCNHVMVTMSRNKSSCKSCKCKRKEGDVECGLQIVGIYRLLSYFLWRELVRQQGLRQTIYNQYSIH